MNLKALVAVKIKKYVYIPEKLVGTAEMSLNSKPKLGNLIFPV